MRRDRASRGQRSSLLTIVACTIFALIGQSCQTEIANASPSAQPAPDSAVRLHQAVMKMNQWLLNNRDAETWRRSLKLNALETQAALGNRANINTLVNLHQIFASNHSSLQYPVFQDVKLALEAQIQSLNGNQFFDPASIARAQANYRPISISELQNQRNSAVYEMKSLRDHYRTFMFSRDRALLFYDLDLDASIAFLEAIEFELPPQFSVGKTESMIRALRKERDEVIKQIDALPLDPEGDENPEGSEEQDDQPGPDNATKSLQELEKDKADLDAKIKALLDQRKEYLKLDGPRRKTRQTVFGELRKIEARFIEKGKERKDPYFFASTTAIERFTRTYFFGTSDNLQEEYLIKLNDLQQQVFDLNSPNSRQAAGEIGDSLRWLENANQASGLVTAIRAQYSLPNAYITVSEGFLNQVAGQAVNQTESLNGTMDGRVVRGSATLNGSVNVDLQDDPNQIHASIQFWANLTSNTMLRQRKLKLYVNADGQVEARRSFYGNIGGLYANSPYAAANVSTRLDATSSKLRFVNRIAQKKFNELKPSSDGSAARSTEKQVLEQFSDQTEEPLADGKDALSNALENLLDNASLAPQIYVRSTNHHIMASAKKSSIATLGAQTTPTSTFPVGLGVQIHDSFASNFFDKEFSNKTFTDKELEEKLSEMFGREMKGLSADEEEGVEDESFSITFAQIRPIQFEFEDNRFSIIVSGRRFAQGDSRINEGLKIILRFKFKRINGKLKFVRDGKAELEYLNKEEKSPRTVAFRSFLDGRLNPKDGGEQISVDLSDNLIPTEEVEGLKDIELLDNLQLVQCRAENGWLYLGWNYQRPGTFTSMIVDTPAIWNEGSIGGMDPAYLLDGQRIPPIVEAPQQ